mmetsp:Transcript_11414/g.24538  ORF Transcript_11414/g.24538 Transcript_11414/m.24538 type:complete len:87 (+) Transcript_11414:633-893(+)
MGLNRAGSIGLAQLGSIGLFLVGLQKRRLNRARIHCWRLGGSPESPLPAVPAAAVKVAMQNVCSRCACLASAEAVPAQQQQQQQQL